MAIWSMPLSKFQDVSLVHIKYKHKHKTLYKRASWYCLRGKNNHFSSVSVPEKLCPAHISSMLPLEDPMPVVIYGV